MSNRESRRTEVWFSRCAVALFVLAPAALGVSLYRDAAETVRRASPGWKRRFQSDFPGLPGGGALTETERRSVIAAANGSECRCGCGYTVAACLNEDASCPRRDENLARVAGWSKEAGALAPEGR